MGFLTVVAISRFESSSETSKHSVALGAIFAMRPWSMKLVIAILTNPIASYRFPSFPASFIKSVMGVSRECNIYGCYSVFLIIKYSTTICTFLMWISPLAHKFLVLCPGVSIITFIIIIPAKSKMHPSGSKNAKVRAFRLCDCIRNYFFNYLCSYVFLGP